MDKRISATAAFLGMLAVILGAFTAHALKKVLSVGELTTFETGVRYQLYHAFFLFFVATQKKLSQKSLKLIYNMTLAGVILFSGSIYLLATNNLTPFFDFRIIGFVTPIGGLLLILAWAVLFVKIIKQKQ